LYLTTKLLICANRFNPENKILSSCLIEQRSFILTQEMKVELKNYQNNLMRLENEYQDVILKHCGKLRERLVEERRRKHVSNISKTIAYDVYQLYRERKDIKNLKVQGTNVSLE
jgi:hypothetical protein